MYMYKTVHGLDCHVNVHVLRQAVKLSSDNLQSLFDWSSLFPKMNAYPLVQRVKSMECVFLKVCQFIAQLSAQHEVYPPLFHQLNSKLNSTSAGKSKINASHTRPYNKF